MQHQVIDRLFAHNNWANDELIAACLELSDDILDAVPKSRPSWSVRATLAHLVDAQDGYLSLLTRTLDARLARASTGTETSRKRSVSLETLRESAKKSGDGLREVALGASPVAELPVRTTDGYTTEPWVVLVQAIQHATEHRKQIAQTLREFGIEPPRLDGWTFGGSEGALEQVPPSQ